MQMQMQTQWGTPADACQARVGVPALGVPGHITLRTRAAILRIPLVGDVGCTSSLARPDSRMGHQGDQAGA